MIKTIRSKYNSTYLLAFIVSFCLLLIRINNYIAGGHNELVYAPGEINMFDNSLLRDNCDIGIEEGIISTKYINQIIVSFLMKLNLPWSYTRLIFAIVAMIIFSVAIINICKKIEVNNIIFCSLILSMGIMTSKTGNLAGFDQFAYIGSSAEVGIAFAILGLSFCIGKNKNWLFGIICACFSLIFHIHEGIYGLGIILILWIAESIINKKISIKQLKGLILWIIVAVIVAIPPILTDKHLFTSKEFADLYVNFRVPHHLLVSGWGKNGIFIQLISYAVAFMSLFLTYKDNRRKLNEAITTSIIMLICFFLIVLMVLMFDKIIPSSFIIKLWLPKMFKYISIYFMIIFTMYIDVLFNQKKYVIIIYLSITMIFSNSMFIFVLPVIAMELIKQYGHEKIIDYELIFMISIFAIAFFLTGKKISIDSNLNGKEYFLIFIMIFTFMMQLVYNKNLKIEINCVSLNVSNMSKIFCLIIIIITLCSPNVIKFTNAEYFLKNAAGSSIYNLATDFKSKTHKKDGILVDPYNMNAGYIQIIAQRNCYVLHKQMASTENGMYEWKKRLDKIGKLENRTVDDIYNVMLDINYKYVLVEAKRFEEFNSSSKFEPYLKEKDYIIYKVNL